MTIRTLRTLSQILAFRSAWTAYFSVKLVTVLLVAGLETAVADPVRAADAVPTSIRLLTIGNSFADNATEMLPPLAASRGITVIVGKANRPGCGLAQHAENVAGGNGADDDAGRRPYKDGDNNPCTLVESLESQPWDYVSLQQVSGESFKPESYEPHAGLLVEAIHAHAPQARLVVHQTWAYREDHPLFGEETLDQAGMHRGLQEAYGRLADRYGCLLIPVGDAFQFARAMPQWTFRYPDPDYDYLDPPEGRIPDQSGSLTEGYRLALDASSGSRRLQLDGKHANTAGKYLAACVFFEVLTSDSACAVEWVPAGLDDSQAATLRAAAHLAVAASGRRQVPQNVRRWPQPCGGPAR